jgi:uncharacterized repeat protein (TIGR01451 family)
MADRFRVPARRRVSALLSSVAVAVLAADAHAAGTAVGTVIENTAIVDFSLDGNPRSLTSNTTTVTVAERIDVVVTLQSPQVLVAAGDTNRALLFTVTNTGNGSEAFALALDSNLAGDDFDPVPAATSIYFDSDASGDFNVGDQAYVPGSNEPVLAPDASVNVLLVNDIPASVTDGQRGFGQLTATAVTGADVPGTVFAGAGDGGTDAVIGGTGGEQDQVGEYLVAAVDVSIVKTQAVSDPFGGAEPVPGATIRYTVTIEVLSSGTARDSVFADPIPTYTTYVPDSLTLNTVSLSDATDADAGEIDNTGAPSVVIRLGDLTSAAGVQTVEFDVTID